MYLDRTFQILRWEAVYVNNKIKPMIFINGNNIDFVEYTAINENKVWLMITDTGSAAYDGKIFYGIAEKGTDCAYVITLDTCWLGYPLKLGKFQLMVGTVAYDRYGETPITEPLTYEAAEKYACQPGNEDVIVVALPDQHLNSI